MVVLYSTVGCHLLAALYSQMSLAIWVLYKMVRFLVLYITLSPVSISEFGRIYGDARCSSFPSEIAYFDILFCSKL